ncbi:PEP-CTERM sorting domain-containing protein [Sphingomonas sp. CL5.1]|uniref:FxDxF family PEP-CTERM protein n=1 Tax=Sphingomonas sp. CL5.1 TaxID=2653203 RepID=UPI0015834CB3|nr:FxDxF family PEP-CTERM protein [Sphingomonas sp. CL5.1]QKS01788.1 PEP-CTERM sorting domain-containing protein [Sphingomonas sp. CL5.1]
MKKLAFATAAALAAVSAVPASAVTTSITLQPIGGTYNAVFGNTDPYATGQKYGFFNSLAKGTDVYNFTVPTNGDLYGFVGSVGLYLTLTNLDFTSVMLDNGIAFNKVSDGVFELQTLAASSLLAGNHYITVKYNNAQIGSNYAGLLSFNPSSGAVPEPATWALMILGFGMVAGAMRYRRRETAVRFA